MSDGRIARVAAVVVAIGCSKQSAPVASAAAADSAAHAAAPVAAAPGPQCPANGLWARCSVMYRLERSGLVPKVDSTAKPERVSLRGEGFVIKIGRLASLDVFLYPDSTSRIADERTLDRSDLVAPGAPQTIRRERTLIENANLVALLTSLNDHQRERVSDALTAGAPQPPSR
jgi:hypothetical protein